MKKLRFLLCGLLATLGLASCEAPEFVTKIFPGLANSSSKVEKDNDDSKTDNNTQNQNNTNTNTNNNTNTNTNTNTNNNNNTNTTTPAAVSDTLTVESTGITSGTTVYGEWSGFTGTSGAVYAGQSAGGHGAIQIRTNNSNSGIVTTKSGGKITSVSVEFNENTSNERVLNVYASNSAYSSAADLYSGEPVGTIEVGGSNSLSISGSYTFVGVRSKSGAIFLDSITFNWNGGSSTSNTQTTTSYTLQSAVQAAADLMSEYFDFTLSVHDDDGYYTGINVGDLWTLTELKSLVPSFVPNGFIVDGTWEEDTFEDNTPCEWIDYVNDEICLEYTVYEKDGANILQVESFNYYE